MPKGHTTSVCFSQECIFFAVFEKDSKGNLFVYLGIACFLENMSFGTLRTVSFDSSRKDQSDSASRESYGRLTSPFQ